MPCFCCFYVAECAIHCVTCFPLAIHLCFSRRLSCPLIFTESSFSCFPWFPSLSKVVLLEVNREAVWIFLSTQSSRGSGCWRGEGSGSYRHSHQETILNHGFGKLYISGACSLHIIWLCLIFFTIYFRQDSCLIRICLDSCWLFTWRNISTRHIFTAEAFKECSVSSHTKWASICVCHAQSLLN